MHKSNRQGKRGRKYLYLAVSVNQSRAKAFGTPRREKGEKKMPLRQKNEEADQVISFFYRLFIFVLPSTTIPLTSLDNLSKT
jgi:hypothetical protein